MRLTNPWNLFIYRLWAPVYDPFLDRVFYSRARQRSMRTLGLKPGERVLLTGVGTGADLPLLPAGVRALGIDLSPDMLAQARAKLPPAGVDVELRQGDAQALDVETGTFDAAVLHLIISVAPDGAACLREAMRVLRPGGRAVVFDKFLPAGGRRTHVRRLLGFFAALIGTDINRRFEDIASGIPLRIVSDEPVLLGGMYRILLLQKIH